MRNIIITTNGGSGSSYISRKLKAQRKADVIFRNDVTVADDIVAVADKEARGYFSKHRLHPMYHWEKYIAAMIKKHTYVVLGGGICNSPGWMSWATGHCVAFVRHPLWAMESLYYRRHPEYRNNYESLIDMASHHGLFWNNVVSQVCECNIPVIRYEYAYADAILKLSHKEKKLIDVMETIDSDRRGENLIPQDVQEYLRQFVEKQYNKIYNAWEI